MVSKANGRTSRQKKSSFGLSLEQASFSRC